MADKLPVIIDNRGDNTVLRAFEKLPDLHRMRSAADLMEVHIL